MALQLRAFFFDRPQLLEFFQLLVVVTLYLNYFLPEVVVLAGQGVRKYCQLLHLHDLILLLLHELLQSLVFDLHLVQLLRDSSLVHFLFKKSLRELIDLSL